MVQFTVTNLEDSGTGSLRQAMEDANAQPGKDEIVFEDSLSGGRIDLIADESGFELDITDSVSIQGLGAEQLAISSNTTIFGINDGTENVIEVEIDGLSLVENGTRDLGRFGLYGAAIINRENLTVTNSVIRDGDPFSDGIIVNGYDNLAELTLIDSTISGYQNGIDSSGENLNIIRSSIFDNSYRGILSRGDGIGGLFTVNNSIGTVEIRESTISGNGGSEPYAAYKGGILINGDSVTTVTITSSTIANNYSSGIYYRASYDTPSSEFVITSSIIAGNRAIESSNDTEVGDLTGEGVFTSRGNNLIGIAGDTSFENGVNGDLVGTADNPLDPGLTPLQNNGGNTPTQALLSNSPAIDAGSNPNDLEFDQRGEGFARVVGNNADIGAVEFQDIGTLVSIVATTPVATEGESNGVFTVSRGEQTEGELVVNLVIDGETTVDLEDYNLLGNNFSVTGDRITVTIPDGESSTEIVLEPVNDALAESAEALVLGITASSEYDIDGNNPLATVTIPQNDFDGNTLVTNTNDEGAGSLRQAILNANLFEGTDTITFDPSLQGETITLTSGELIITDAVNIEGIENRSITISGNNNSRVFNIDDGNDEERIDVNISDVVITEGLIDIEDNVSGPPEPVASGIFSSENLTISDSTITGNTGDGIVVENGFLNIDNSSIENNSNSGIENLFSTLEIRNSSITGNRFGINNSYAYSYDTNYDATLLVEQSTISGNNLGIINDSNATASIDNSTITSSISIAIPYSSYTSDGIGISNRGSMTINNTTITNNQGGGVDNFGNLEINKTTISKNANNSFSIGGGISNNSSSSATIIDSIISDNSASSGGGIANDSYGNLEVIGSVISDNRSGEIAGYAYGGNGGGIENRGTATITNSTISGNASDKGGAISNGTNRYYYEEDKTSLSIFNSTITGNSASQGSGIYNGVYVDNYGNYNEGTYTSNATITSTIIAQNTGDRDLAGESVFISNGNNLIGNGDGADGFTDGVNGDLVGTINNPIDPLLGTLQDNGGTTQTIALLTGSPAIDAGSNPLNLTTDQRGEGFPRTIDGNSDGVAVTDIGSFEADFGTLPNPPDGGGGNGNDGEVIIGTDGQDSLVGGVGNDTIDGGNGKDTLFGGAGNDELFGGQGFDSLVGNNGSDTLNGGNGADNLNGSAGNDQLFGNSGGDFLVGNSGNDFIDGGNGSDTLVGGLGEDSFVIRQQKGVDNIIDYIDGTDKFVLSDGLTFGQLNLVPGNNSTEIRLAENNRLLTRVSSVSANVISEEDFQMNQ